MNDKYYPRFQYSVFTNDPDNGQLVIRSDSFEELLQGKKEIDKILDKIDQKNEGKKEVSSKPATVNQSTDWMGERQGKTSMTTGENYCTIHKTEMKGKEGRYGFFYSHWIGKDESGKSLYCNGKAK
jgi:hypothetical protein